MKLYINGRFLTQKITGVQRFGIEVIKELDLFVENNQIEILTPPGIINDLKLKNIKITIIGKKSNNYWTQVTLPLFVMRRKGIILTMAGLCPIIKPDYTVAHDITFIRYPESFGNSFRWIYNWGYKLSLNRCKKVFTVSNFSKKELINYFGLLENLIEVVNPSCSHLSRNEYHEVKLDKWDLQDRVYYLSVSSQNLHKNQNYIYECALKNPDAIFVIVGGSVLKSFKNIYVQECPNLIYTGYVMEDELYTLYKNANGFIFPSLYEGFGLPPLEAIMMGVKHIAVSDIEVFHEVYNRGVYYFNPNNVGDFSIERMNQTQLSEEDVQYYLDKYTWKIAAKNIYKAIKG